MAEFIISNFICSKSIDNCTFFTLTSVCTCCLSFAMKQSLVKKKKSIDKNMKQSLIKSLLTRIQVLFHTLFSLWCMQKASDE